MSLSSSSSVDVMAAAAAIGGPPASPARELALFVLDQTLLGLRTAAQAVATVVKDPYVVSLHKHILIPLLGLSLLFYLGTIVPLRLILWFTGLSSQTPRVQQWYWVMNTTIPILINIILRFVWYAPLDRCYLAVLSSLDESLTADLRKRAPRSGWDIAKTEAKRWMSVVLFLPIYWLLSWIPLVGRGLKFIFKLYTLSRYLSPSHTVAAAVITTFPLTEYPSTLLLSFLLSLTASLQELNLPYLGRQQPPLSRRAELALLVRENPQKVAALAFVLPFTLVLMIPILGPLSIIIAHAAAPVALVNLVLPQRKKEGGRGEGNAKEEVEKKKKAK